MSHSFPSDGPDARATVYRVEAPRASDAVGVSLRDAFGREPDLPEDMAALLRRLNRPRRRDAGVNARG